MAKSLFYIPTFFAITTFLRERMAESPFSILTLFAITTSLGRSRTEGV
jgi:hypothetical protein